MQYRLVRELEEFTRLCYLWRQDSRTVPCDLNEYWGPPEHDMMVAAALEFTSQVDFSLYEQPEEQLSASEEEEEGYEDEELFLQMEAVALRDEYGQGPEHSIHFNAEYSSDDTMQASPTKKRPRRK